MATESNQSTPAAQSIPAAQSTASAFTMGQATMARGLRSLLALSHQLGERQSKATRGLLQSSLGGIHPGVVQSMRALLDVQSDLVIGISVQWKDTLDGFIDRSATCIADLRQADEHDEVMGVLAMYASDLGDKAHDDAERAGKLFGSAGEATKLLVSRVLDDMSDDLDEQPPAG
jgi:hypothetical protein